MAVRREIYFKTIKEDENFFFYETQNRNFENSSSQGYIIFRCQAHKKINS